MARNMHSHHSPCVTPVYKSLLINLKHTPWPEVRFSLYGAFILLQDLTALQLSVCCSAYQRQVYAAGKQLETSAWAFSWHSVKCQWYGVPASNVCECLYFCVSLYSTCLLDSLMFATVYDCTWACTVCNCFSRLRRASSSSSCCSSKVFFSTSSWRICPLRYSFWRVSSCRNSYTPDHKQKWRSERKAGRRIGYTCQYSLI